MMIHSKQNQAIDLPGLTNLAVRSYWIDGLWDLASAGMFLLLGLWGAFYVRFVAFPIATWPAFQEMGRSMVWLGLVVLIVALIPFIWLAWLVVKYLKRVFVSRYMGYADHRFFMPVDRKLFVWYFVLYVAGLALLYGLFYWIKDGPYVMSVPFIISPAAIFWATGRVYGIRRYQVIAVIGLIMALSLELLLTTGADYLAGPRSFIDVIPAYGCPTLACIVWAVMCTASGLVGLLGVRRHDHGAG
ncbi:MAG: hypothetical protein ACWGO1_10230 [Anaerolineales bacterium]